MTAAMLLGGLLIWLAIAMGVGLAAYRWHGKRWLQVTLTLFVLWLPFWDVIPGYILYRQAVREFGGVRIYRTVEAEGYLDLTATDCDACWSQLREPGPAFLEIRRTWQSGLLSRMEQGEGYYTYRLRQSSNEHCGAFNSLENAERLRQIYLPAGMCVESTFSPTPVSNYEFSSEVQDYPATRRWRPVTIEWQIVRETRATKITAESARVYFTSWLGQQLDIPMWRHVVTPAGNHIELRLREIFVSG